ncbi:Ig-like domain-containing protein [Streptomyces sp. TS71-3]|uniref:L,D-transpeptidase n=1 Tax=Streptomyces sp. TS71-3 TaxID=2733862 RepID=UPI002017B894|nr:Ig-like domain-containing protein [Streptomyces sp. TS71-3]
MRVVRRAPRAGVVLAAGLCGAALLASAAGCGAGGLLGEPPSAKDAIAVTPADGSGHVALGRPIGVRVRSGRLESVRVVRYQDAQRFTVPGRISTDGLSWRPAESGRLVTAARYTVDAVALDGHGRRSARHAAFRTLVPDHRFIGYVTPQNRTTVGTGMIISLEFNRSIRNRAAVQRAVRVVARPAVPIAPHWFGHDRLDFRPEHYWRPGTRVTVELRLQDVVAAPGVYGLQSRTITFTVGRNQTSRVDAAAHTMQVRRDGKLISTLPITAGAPSTTTYNGKMVVSEMLKETRMNSRTVGFGGEYDIPDVPHALRLTSSGTFLHGNYWAEDVFGTENVSHGCVGLRDVKGGGDSTPAGWFFARSLVGDVIEVVNSQDRLVDPGNGLSGWNMSWPRWRAGAA